MFSLKNYSDFYKTIDHHNNSFFIGANTPKGFVYADKNLLSEASFTKLYIIKGGPGTGKSTLMKKCRDHFESIGFKSFSYYCSSDPDSLDLLIIESNDKRIAIADGTAPHSLDASIPGAVSEIIDLGTCWTSDILEENLHRIASECAKKSLSFENAKKYLAAASEVKTVLRKTAETGFDEEKAKKFIRRLLSSIPKQKTSAEKHTVITEAISMKGALRLSTFDSAQTIIGVCDFAGISPIFFELLASGLEKSERSLVVSYSPLGDISEIYLPVQNIAFVPVRQGLNYFKIIRLSRFANKEYFSSSMAKRRFNERCFLKLLDGALASLADAKQHHFALEEIYSKAMDFGAIDIIENRLLNSIEKKLL